jgi:type VI secretion system protein ImpF
MKDSDRIVRRSVLDRLLQTGDPEPRTWQDSLRAAKASLARDVEWLLNTRSIADPAPEELTELRDSVYHYGLRDVSSLSADSLTARRELLRTVADTIERFEPRLSGVRVREVAKQAEGKREIHFVVEGMLRLHPEPEPVSFDTVLEATSGRFNLSGGG